MFFLVSIFVIVWTQWVATVQGAVQRARRRRRGRTSRPRSGRTSPSDAVSAAGAGARRRCGVTERRDRTGAHGRRRRRPQAARCAGHHEALRRHHRAQRRRPRRASTARWSGSSDRTAPGRPRCSTACSACCAPKAAPIVVRRRRDQRAARVQAGPARVRAHVPTARAVRRHDGARPLPRRRTAAQRLRAASGRTC